jgi:hypothetical protein
VTVHKTLRQIALGRREGVAGTVYGTIVVMATVAAGSQGEETHAWKLATVVAVTVLVLWVAHVYSHVLAEGLRQGRQLTASEIASVARSELSIALAAVAPVAVLALAQLGALEAQTAVWVALGIGVATLAYQGARYAEVEHLGRLGRAVSISLNVVLGLAIVLLEASITH